MPSSDIHLIPHVCTQFRALMPNSVLDIGIGFGKYGFLAREYLDIYEERYQPITWRTKIDGIEIFADYVGNLQRIFYNNIYIGDALDCLRKLDNYDLILLLDVIEHIEKTRGFELLKLISEKSEVALISSPIKVKSLGAPLMKYGNIYERHLSQWTEEELGQFGGVKKVASGKGTYLLEIRK